MKIKNILLSTLCLSLSLGALVSCGKKENSADATSIKTSTSKKTSTSTSTSKDTSTSFESSTSKDTSTSFETSTSTSTKTSTTTTKEDDEDLFDTMEFGSFPQTKVNDEQLILTLNTKAGQLPNENELNDWNDYNYKSFPDNKSFIYYIDIDLNEDGSNDYRGVYFNQYQTITSNCNHIEDYTNQDDNGYEINNVYWFKYEPIKWYSFQEDDKILLVSKYVLAASEFVNPDMSVYGDDYSTNNYELSKIRNVLNNEFYSLVFNDSEKEKILTTLVDNSLSSTCMEENQYVCNNTEDKLFLLSIAEKNKYFKEDTNCLALGTDYAKCQGIQIHTHSTDYTFWSLRTPSPKYNFRICEIEYTGKLASDLYQVYSRYLGIRPALYIDLNN
jgi:hypothetical protein